MATPSASRPSRCHYCGEPACRGDCKSCPKRQAGTCGEFYLTITEKTDIGTVHRWACWRCKLKR